jgi:hypothetical protein
MPLSHAKGSWVLTLCVCPCVPAGADTGDGRGGAQPQPGQPHRVCQHQRLSGAVPLQYTSTRLLDWPVTALLTYIVEFCTHRLHVSIYCTAYTKK